jgi:hypothetical protein
MPLYVDTLNAGTILQGGNPVKPYKVYTALLTQSGGDVPFGVAGDGEEIVLGITYEITDNPNNNDLTVYGAPNNNVGTFFVANQTINLPYTNALQLLGNLGAPVVTVLENTIGNIWFGYVNPGYYDIKSDGLFIIDKTWSDGNFIYDGVNGIYQPVFVNVSNAQGAELPNTIQVRTFGGDFNGDSLLNNTPIEIRVYN